jgi:hypothetical protein
MGNPADDKEVVEQMSYFKKDNNRNREVKQSLPIQYKHMEKFHDFFNDSTPDRAFSEPLKVQLDALFTLAFICLFRIDEVLSMRMTDIVEDVLENIEGEETLPYTSVSVSVTFRKSNQNDRTKKSVYKLFSNEKEKKINARIKLKLYLKMLKKNEDISEKSFLFPKINGETIDFSAPTSHAQITSYLNTLTEKLQLLENSSTGRFTTHCFRRGGAQFRFMYSKPRWSLEAIKWWGGWSSGEQGGSVYKYVLEEYSRIEYDYSDMLSPFRKDRNISATEMSTENPLTLGHFLAFSNEISENIKELKDILKQFQSTNTTTASNTITPSQITQSLPRNRGRRGKRIATIRVDPPVLNIGIPSVKNYQDIIRQWHEGDPNIGLKPLKDFTKKERNLTRNRKALYSKRKLVAEEYIYLGESQFKETYSDFLEKGLNVLIRAINRTRNERAN